MGFKYERNTVSYANSGKNVTNYESSSLNSAVNSYLKPEDQWSSNAHLIMLFIMKSCNIKDMSIRPPIQLLHSNIQYCIMKKRDLFAMNEMDLVCGSFIHSVRSRD